MLLIQKQEYFMDFVANQVKSVLHIAHLMHEYKNQDFVKAIQKRSVCVTLFFVIGMAFYIQK